MTTTTAAQRHEQAKAAFEAYLAACPTRALIGIIATKWSSMVLLDLAGGPRRYADLARARPGASAKMLTQTLRSLERDGLVSRRVTPAVPVRVEYALTPLGDRLVPLLHSLREWAEHNMDEVRAARERHDG